MNSENFDMDSITNFMVETFSMVKDEAENILNAPEAQETIEYMKALDETASSAIDVYKKIKQIASLPTKIFMKKVELYMRGLYNISPEKRQKYLDKVGKKGLNEDSVFILGVLNKIEELSKIDILLKLFSAKMDGVIEDTAYRRFMVMTDRTLYSDLLLMKKDIKDGEFKIKNEEQEGLVTSGWIAYKGQTFGEIGSDDEDLRVYSYTHFAKQFCSVVFMNVLSDAGDKMSTNIEPMGNDSVDDIINGTYTDDDA